MGGESDMVVGVDAGGTATRALAMDAIGSALGTGTSGGANPNSHPTERAAGHITQAVRAALAGHDRTRVAACVIGMAGASKLGDPDAAGVFDRAWDELALDIRPTVVSDAEAAFASATTAPDGTVLVGGTGSIAGRIRDRRRVAAVGGYGWLLGDEGSAFWVGRAAVRSALDALTRGWPLGLLAHAVLEQADVSPPTSEDSLARLHTAHRLITVVNAASPIDLARFAPLVSAADARGDATARTINEDAARLLAETAMAARDPEEATPVVLVGSVLSEDSPIGALVRAKLRGLDVFASKDGVLGAAWLAALDAFGQQALRPRVGEHGTTAG